MRDPRTAAAAPPAPRARCGRRATLFVVILAAAMGAGAAGVEPRGAPNSTAVAPADLHTSRNSLDWAGAYEGAAPCAGCRGRRTRLVLGADGTYELWSERSGGGVPQEIRGRFRWRPDGNSIVLDGGGGGQVVAVGEGQVVLRRGGPATEGPAAPDLVLRQVPRK